MLQGGLESDYLGHFIFCWAVIFVVRFLSFSLYRKFCHIFHWARGAVSREQPKEDRGKFAMLTFPLSPLGFSLELPFPHSLSPLVPLRFR